MYCEEAISMAVIKRTYAIPEEIVRQFEKVVVPGKRSVVISELISGWLADQRREELRRAVIEGCLDMTEAHMGGGQ